MAAGPVSGAHLSGTDEVCRGPCSGEKTERLSAGTARRYPARMTTRILLFAALALSPAPAFAVADGPDHFRVIRVAAGDVLNIRAAPDAKAAILGTIPPDGDGIRNLGCQGGLSIDDWMRASEAEREKSARRRWCRVEYRGVEGWSAGFYLGEGSAP